MFTNDIEDIFRELVEQQDESYKYLMLLSQKLPSSDDDIFIFTQNEESLFNKANQLFQLIRFMIKNNYLLKRNHLFQLGEMFKLFRNIQQSLMDELNLMMKDKIIINRENKVRGDLQWQ